VLFVLLSLLSCLLLWLLRNMFLYLFMYCYYYVYIYIVILYILSWQTWYYMQCPASAGKLTLWTANVKATERNHVNLTERLTCSNNLSPVKKSMCDQQTSTNIGKYQEAISSYQNPSNPSVIWLNMSKLKNSNPSLTLWLFNIAMENHHVIIFNR